MPESTRNAVPRKELTKEKAIMKIRTNHLLLIGIDKYKNDNIPNLNNAVRDAENFRDILISQYQFLPENITSLFNEEATRSNIMHAFSKMLKKLTDQDNLIFYYSGHGIHINSGKSKRGYWVQTETVLGDDWTCIPNDEIIQLFKNSRAHHVFGIVDSCFSGSLFPHRNLDTAAADERIDSYPSRWLLTAGRLETVSDGMSGGNSPFAEAILTYLKNNPDNSFWVSDLCNRVLKGVNYNTEKQTPRGEALQDVGHYGGQFVFHKKGYVPKVVAAVESTTPTTKKGINKPIEEKPASPPNSLNYQSAKGNSFSIDLQRLEQAGLKSQAEIIIKKLNRLNEALLMETDISVQFKYEHLVEKLEKQLAALKEQLS